MEQIKKRLDSIDQSLQEHMRRTDILEHKMLTFDRLVTEATGAIKMLRWLGWIVATCAAISEVIHWLK